MCGNRVRSRTDRYFIYFVCVCFFVYFCVFLLISVQKACCCVSCVTYKGLFQVNLLGLLCGAMLKYVSFAILLVVVMGCGVRCVPV